MLLTKKYVDGLSLNRQQKIWKCEGVELSSDSISNRSHSHSSRTFHRSIDTDHTKLMFVTTVDDAYVYTTYNAVRVGTQVGFSQSWNTDTSATLSMYRKVSGTETKVNVLGYTGSEVPSFFILDENTKATIKNSVDGGYTIAIAGDITLGQSTYPFCNKGEATFVVEIREISRKH